MLEKKVLVWSLMEVRRVTEYKEGHCWSTESLGYGWFWRDGEQKEENQPGVIQDDDIILCSPGTKVLYDMYGDSTAIQVERPHMTCWLHQWNSPVVHEGVCDANTH